MLSDFMVLLLEDGPALQQRMEMEILQSFGSRRDMGARELCRMNYHLLSRNPGLFEEAVKAVTQKVSEHEMTPGDLSGPISVLCVMDNLLMRQIDLLPPSQKSAMSGSVNPVQRLLPHLAAVLCSVGRHPGEPRRALVAEAVVTLRSTAAAPPAKKARTRKDSGHIVMELQALRDAFTAVLKHLPLQRSEATMVASSVLRCLELLLRRETHGSPTGLPAPEDTSPRPDPMDRSDGDASFDWTWFDPPRVLRALGDGVMEAVGEALRQEEMRRGEGEDCKVAGDDDEEDDDDDDDEMGENGDEALAEEDCCVFPCSLNDDRQDEDEDEGGEMDQIDGEEDPEMHVDEGEEDDEEGEYDEGEEAGRGPDLEDYGGEAADFGQDGHGIASVLQNAIQVHDQESPRMEGDSMTFRVDIDLGDAGMIHGVHRGGGQPEIPEWKQLDVLHISEEELL
eukprot:g19345.t1